MTTSFKSYLLVTKPGIIFGNAITAIAGFALASDQRFDVYLFTWMLLGLSLIVASGCVSNNYLDREIDKKMARTHNRPLVTGAVSPHQALVFSLALALAGSAVLGLYVNFLSLATALFGLFFYVGVYSLAKYRSRHATLIGSIAGAIPPLVGYFAVKPHFDFASSLLFLITALWQMPHFYAIAIYRIDDYAKASIPVLPLMKGIETTKRCMIGYTLMFVLATICLPITGLVGLFFFLVMAPLGLGWLGLELQGLKSLDPNVWARRIFFFSLLIICAMTLAIVIDTQFI